MQGKTWWWFATSIRAVAPGAAKWLVSSRPKRGAMGGLLAAVPLPPLPAPHRRQHRRSQLALSSKHPLSALNPRSRHTLRSGEGPPLAGRGRWREQDVIFVISRASKAGRQRGGGRGAAGSRGAASPLPSLPAGRLTWCTAAPGGRSPGKAEGCRRQGGEKPHRRCLSPPSLPNSACGLCARGTIFSAAEMVVWSTACGLRQLLKAALPKMI